MAVHRCGERLLTVLLVAVGLMLVQQSPAAAADGIRITVDSTYEVAPDDGVVYVTNDIEVTNTSRNRTTKTQIIRYYYDQLSFPVPPDATNVAAMSGKKQLAVEMRNDHGGDFLTATIDLPRRLFYKQTQNIVLTFDIVGAEPRSLLSDVRVNPAYVWFYAWSMGDPGRSSVSIVIPSRFETSVTDATMQRSFTASDETIYRAEDIEEPYEWFATVSGFDDGALATATAEIGADSAEIRYWPGDEKWRDTVTETLARSGDALIAATGVPWPVGDDLVIRETVAPNTYGYAGWYLLDSDEIEIGEHLDEHLILHEVAHAWFNDTLFKERWIAEGLAEEISAMVIRDEYGELALPSIPSGSEGALALNAWREPIFSTDESDAREDYGYATSWWVMHQIAEEIGPEALAAVIAGAANDEIAYLGPGAPETVEGVDDWRRFIDLIEERGETDEATQLFHDLVVMTNQGNALDDRGVARTAYAELVAAADGWAIPISVRMPMSEWAFDTAHERIGMAHDALGEYERIQELGAERSLTVPAVFQPEFETATEGFDAIYALADGFETTMTAMDDAAAVVTADRDLYTTVGMENLNPEARLEASRAAFEANDAELAEYEAAFAIAIVEYAPVIGKQRVVRDRMITATSVMAGVLLLTLVAVRGARLWSRRRPSRSDPGDDSPMEIIEEPLALAPASE